MPNMGKLPGHERAIIPSEKLRYCLDPAHPTGSHKARVFSSALGLEPSDATVLERMLRDGIASHEGHLRFTLIDGSERWVVEWTVLGRLGPIRLLSAWNVFGPVEAPRLVTSYLKQVRR